MHVRFVTVEDVPAALAFSNHAAAVGVANFATQPEPLSAWQAAFEATHGRYPWLVAEDHAGVVGFARSGPWKARQAYAWSAEVTVYVHHEHHRRGIGRALYARLLGLLDAQGYRTLMAGITLPNPGSVGLHEAFGFQQVAAFRQIGWKSGQWHTVGYWQRLSGEGPPGELRPVSAVA